MSANNHYAGFGPGTANIFRKMVGLPEAQFSKDEENKKEEDDKPYLHGSSHIIQDHSKKHHVRFYDINSYPLQSHLSPILSQ